MPGRGTALVHLYYEKFLTAPGDLDTADEIFAPEVVFHNPISPDGIHGIDEYKKFAMRWYQGFPDRVFTVNDTVEEADKVAASFTTTRSPSSRKRGTSLKLACTMWFSLL